MVEYIETIVKVISLHRLDLVKNTCMRMQVFLDFTMPYYSPLATGDSHANCRPCCDDLIMIVPVHCCVDVFIPVPIT